jgi:hypothetical protein
MTLSRKARANGKSSKHGTAQLSRRQSQTGNGVIPEIRASASNKSSETLVAALVKVIHKTGIKRESIFSDKSAKRVYAYAVLPSDPSKIVREAVDGSKTIGRLRNGKFRPLKAKNA